MNYVLKISMEMLKILSKHITLIKFKELTMSLDNDQKFQQLVCQLSFKYFG